MKTLRHFAALLILPAMLACSSNVSRDINEQRTWVNESAVTVGRLVNDPQFPELRDYIKRSKAVLIIPNMYRAGFIVGGEYGHGVLITKTDASTSAPQSTTGATASNGSIETEDLQNGNHTVSGPAQNLTDNVSSNVNTAGAWGNPMFYRLSGGSVGLQIGGQAAEIVITIMTDKGLERLMHNSLKLGADLSVAVGPVGQNIAAGTAVSPGHADMYTFGQTAGLYGGASLSGAVLSEDSTSNVMVYGVAQPDYILNRTDSPIAESTNLRTALGQ